MLCISKADWQPQVQEKTDILAAEQRLIFKGQVLKDERDVASYGARPNEFAALEELACPCAELL